MAFRSPTWNAELPLLVFVQLVLVAIGIGWLALNNVEAGVQYMWMFLGGIGITTLLFLFSKEEARSSVLNKIKKPFTTDNDVAVGMYVLGWLLPFVIMFISGLLGSVVDVSQVMVPLEGAELAEGIQQSFAAAELASEPFWQWYNVVWVAGTAEEFLFGFALVLALYMLGVFLFRGLFNNEGTALPLGFAIVGSALLFGGAHQLNSTYVGAMFLFAIFFRLLMNLGIYVFGAFLSLTIGYHQANNAIWYWSTYGASSTLSALGSVGGIIIVAYFAVVILYLLRRGDEILRKLPNSFRS